MFTQTTVIAAWASHLLGDYVLQKLLKDIVPNKRDSALGMLIHALYSEALCGLVVGIATHHIVASVVQLVLLHYIVDTMMPMHKTKLQSLLDQAIHAVCMAYTFALMEVL